MILVTFQTECERNVFRIFRNQHYKRSIMSKGIVVIMEILAFGNLESGIKTAHDYQEY